jgi:AmiR/NasT family two-component response regulator
VILRSWVSSLFRPQSSHLAQAYFDRKPAGTARSPARPQTELISVVLITSSHRVQQEFQRIAKIQGWVLVCANQYAEILDVARQRDTGVVLVDRSSLGSDWKDKVNLLLRPAQRCCLILVDSSAFDRFSEAFLEQGGFGVLTTPLNEPEVVHTIRCVWAIWKHLRGSRH